jgi:E3 ubiquitin-protein ligase UBR4
VELKNKPTMWHKAKKVSLTAGQTDIKIEFPLPIVACNLMIEYADYYENIQASSETLQCPRCSASVPANPGVCSNCGENVFQCHKCRSVSVVWGDSDQKVYSKFLLWNFWRRFYC